MRGFPGGTEAEGAAIEFSHAVEAAARPMLGSRISGRGGHGLPLEIAFLSAYGIAPGTLIGAARKALEHNVSAEAVLLGEGLISARAYYQALARHCGVRYFEGNAALATARAYPLAVHAGAVEIVARHGLRWLLAPRGKAIAQLIEATRTRSGTTLAYAMTTPHHMSGLVQRWHRREIVARASFDLANARPDLSAFRQMRARPPLRVLALVMTCLAVLILAELFWDTLTFACGLVFLFAIFVRLSATAMAGVQATEGTSPLPDAVLPIYTIVVPMYDEACVVAQLVAALDAIDYPKAKLDIKIVIEDRDLATKSALVSLPLPETFEIIVAPQGHPRTKPRALNMALPLARGALLTVFDAEDVPDPQQLRLAAARFAQADTTLACVQARLSIDNVYENWLTRMFALEYAALFEVIDPGLAVLGLPMPLGGTSNHFRTSVLREVRGWDAWNVTEDADLGLRLARCGYSVETINSATLEEAPVSLRAWLGQRRRWQKGWMQTIATHLHNPARLVADLGAVRAGLAAAQLLGMVLGPLLGPLFALSMLYSALVGTLLNPQTLFEILASTLSCFVLIAGFWSALWPVLLGARRRELAPCLPWLILLPAYYLLASIATWQGLAEFCTRPFHWQKTAHGVTKFARRDGISPLRRT